MLKIIGRILPILPKKIAAGARGLLCKLHFNDLLFQGISYEKWETLAAFYLFLTKYQMKSGNFFKILFKFSTSTNFYLNQQNIKVIPNKHLI